MNISFLYVNSFNQYGVPIGLSYLISLLKTHKVSLFETSFRRFDYGNFNITKKIDKKGERIISDFKDFLSSVKPQVLCVSTSSLCLEFTLEMIKSLNHRPLTLFGGVGPTCAYDELIENDAVDYICVGEGEECLPRFMNQERNIPNLIGKYFKNNFTQPDLSNLPLPDWSLFDDRHFDRVFKGKKVRGGNFQLTRGCPFNCSYCVNEYYHMHLKMKVRHLPPEKIIREINIKSREYDLDIVRIFDECFGMPDLDYYKHFARLYKDLPPTIVETRPEAITPSLIEILKKIKCISVSLGIEVGNELQRKNMLNRNVPNKTIKRAFSLLHKAGIRCASYNIIGFPHDTKELINETIELNKECKVDFINTFLFSPLPKTKLRDYCLKNNLLETEAIVDYTDRSIVKNDNLPKKKLYSLFRKMQAL